VNDETYETIRSAAKWLMDEAAVVFGAIVTLYNWVVSDPISVASWSGGTVMAIAVAVVILHKKAAHKRRLQRQQEAKDAASRANTAATQTYVDDQYYSDE
jgi:hypothetical protein